MFKKLFSKAGSSLFLLLYLSVMPTIVGGLVASYALTHQADLKSLSLLQQLGISLLSSVFLSIGWMPTTFYSLLSAYLWGMESAPFVVGSYLIASLLGYYFSSLLDNGKLAGALDEKFPVSKVLTKLKESSFWLAAFCRLSPALPFSVMNAMFAMAKYPLVPYVGGSLIGMLPRTCFALFVGEKFSHVQSISELKTDATTWVAVALVAVSFVGLGWIGKKRLT